MGRDSGWLAAAASLGKRDECDAPHTLGLPEILMDEDRFLTLMENAYRAYGFAVAVVAENTRGPRGILGNELVPERVDDFGHAYFQGAGNYLAQQLRNRLRLRVRYEHPGTIQRSMATCISRNDSDEAEMVGREAVRYALAGYTGQMVKLIRDSGQPYRCSVGLAPLERVAGQVKTMPKNYLDCKNYSTTPMFSAYARPLINPLPHFARLDTHVGR